MNYKAAKPKRFYTKKSWKLMNVVRFITLTIFSPIWLPFYALIYFGMWSESFLNLLDSLLDKVLDKVIPQLK